MGNCSCTSTSATAQTSFKLNEKTKDLLENVKGFLKSKNAVNEVAQKCLPEKYMDEFPSRSSELVQSQNSLNQLMQKAESVLTSYEEEMRQIVTDAGLDPDTFPTYLDKKLPLTVDTFFKVLTIAPLKSLDRCKEKVENEYGGRFASLVDIVRCSIVVSTEDELLHVANAMESLEVVRLKNRFKEPLWNGMF